MSPLGMNRITSAGYQSRRRHAVTPSRGRTKARQTDYTNRIFRQRLFQHRAGIGRYRLCWRIESRPHESRVSQYSLSRIWIRKDNYVQAQYENSIQLAWRLRTRVFRKSRASGRPA
jgi:hypothetical protein